MGAFSRRIPGSGGFVFMFRFRRVSFVSLPFAMLLLSACGPFGSETEQPDYWSPFHSQSSWEVDDGSFQVELTGFERGHQPGRQSEFAFKIENRRQVAEEISVCIKLIDELEVVQDLHEFSTQVSASGSVTRPFETTFDEELEPRAYGLAIVITDLGALVHTVRLGIADDEAGPWLDASQLSCDA